jgi:hypothetical protein
MKQVYDRRHREKDYEVGDWVYLRLQPYRQTSISLRKNLKLAPRYYGPFKILRRIGAVAYKLDLPAESKIHPVFHVSLLKEKLGKLTSSQPQLPLVLEAKGEVAVRPQAVLDQRRRRNQQEVLVHWQGLSPADATWENLEFLRKQFPGYVLEDKDHPKEGGVVTVIRGA